MMLLGISILSFYAGIIILIVISFVVPFVAFSIGHEEIHTLLDSGKVLDKTDRLKIYVKALGKAAILALLVGVILWLLVCFFAT